MSTAEDHVPPDRDEIRLDRHCEEQSDEAIQSFWLQDTAGLLRFARNDGQIGTRTSIHHALVTTTARASKRQRRRLFAIVLAAATAQYTILTVLVAASVAAALRYLVTPQIVAQFEAIAAALRH